MRGGSPTGTALALVLLLAGCASSSDTRDGPTDSALHPSTSAVDLHEHRLDLEMAPGQPTMLAVLHVTKDMWVRPLVGMPGARPPVTDDSRWILCPWARTVGLPEDSAWTSLVFLIDDDHLIPTGATDAADRTWHDADASCLGSPGWEAGVYGISSAEPRDATLLVLLTARKLDAPTAPAAWASPAFRFQLGIASKPCQVDASAGYCPPSAEQPAEPARRGAAPGFHEYADGACDACGFEVDDQRTLQRGRIEVRRDAELPSGLTSFTLGFGTSGFAGELVADEERVAAACADVTGNGWAVFLAMHARSLQVDVAFEETGIKGNLAGSVDPIVGYPIGVRARMLEIPLDLASAGWTFAPHARAYAGAPSPDSETTTGLCA